MFMKGNRSEEGDPPPNPQPHILHTQPDRDATATKKALINRPGAKPSRPVVAPGGSRFGNLAVPRYGFPPGEFCKYRL